MTIIEAIDDPRLFAPHFRLHWNHGDTWARWRVLLRALFALPIESPVDLLTFRQCTGLIDPPTEQFSEAALIVGRRGGKSRVLATIAVFLTCFFDYVPFLAPGEVATALVLAADRRQARAIFRFALGLLRSTPILAPMIADSNTEAIVLTNRTTIEIGTASFRTVRSPTLICALADECAFWANDELSANPDTEILRALRPALGTIPGAMLLLASSPYAKKGELYRAYRDYYAKPGAPVLVWKADTLTMNPAFSKSVIDREYEKDAASARAEYGAEFRDDVVDFVAREVVDACTVMGRHELPPLPAVEYTAFVDPSGGSSDSFTLAIAHRTGGRVPSAPAGDDNALKADASIAVLDAIREVQPPFSPESVTRDFAALLKTYGIRRVRGDRYAGEWPRERFAVHGITYEVAEKSASDIYRDTLPLLNAGRVELLDHPRLAAQLCALERRTSRAGRDSISHPPRAHDDIANAATGALLASAVARRKAIVRPLIA